MLPTIEEICKIIRENWQFPPDWEESDMETMDKMMVGKPREIRCITYNIPPGVVYFFPKEADAFNFSKDQIAPVEKDKRVYIKARMDERTMEVDVVDCGIWIPLDTYRKQRELNGPGNECSFWKSGVERPSAKYALLESIPENEAEGTGKCKHDGFDSALQRCRNCGMAAIDIEIERSNDFNRKSKKPISQIEQVPVKEQKKNYCSPGDVFSQCKAGTGWGEQQKCRFSEKATRAEKCMYFRDFNDTNHCDNHLAQKALYLSMEVNNEL